MEMNETAIQISADIPRRRWISSCDNLGERGTYHETDSHDVKMEKRTDDRTIVTSPRPRPRDIPLFVTMIEFKFIIQNLGAFANSKFTHPMIPIR
jgi:hypothetical protein